MTLDNRTRWLALYVLCLGDLMIVLDSTIVNVALPSIREDLNFSQTSLASVVNAYLLTFGGFSAARRAARRSLRTPAPVPDRHLVLHGRLDCLRRVDDAGAADRCTRSARDRRCRRLRGSAVA